MVFIFQFQKSVYQGRTGKMARDKPSINFYADLNKLSTVDVLDAGPKKMKMKSLNGVFKAERLVAVETLKVRKLNDCHDKPS